MTNDTQTLTLPKFLLARIAEEETTVRERVDEMQHPGDLEIAWHTAITETSGYHILAIPAARLLAECEAKRRIIESVGRARRVGTNGLGPSVLFSLAAVYSGHPDYREEWRL